MTEYQLEALHQIAGILHQMLSSLDRNRGRLELLEPIADLVDPDLVDTCRSWESYTLSALGSLGLALSAVADGDEERLGLVTSMLEQWQGHQHG